MDKDYRELIDKVGKENFENRFACVSQSIDKFLMEANYPEWVQCNERILYHVLLDYFADIHRLKEFHDIQHTKTDKVMAYLIYWILRRKPIQLTQYSKDDKDIFVNERFACNMLLSECLLADNAVLTDELAEKLGAYIDLILYYFKYRQYNPQTIELLIESFKMGNAFNIFEG